MPRRTKAEALETRARILDAAASLFCREGVAQTSLDDIAKAVGVTRGAVYWHFKNKDDILGALWDESGSPERMPDTGPRSDIDADPLGYLRERAIQTLKDAVADRRTRQVWTLVFHKMELGASPLSERVMKSRRKCRERVFGFFMAARQAGQIDSSLGADLITSAYFSYLDGLIYNWLRDADQVALEDEAVGFVDLFFRNLG